MPNVSQTSVKQLCFTPTTGDDSTLSLAPRQLIFTRLRQTAAMASGLEALAVMAIDSGEATPEQLDHIAGLAGHLTEQLSNLANLFAEITGGQQ